MPMPDLYDDREVEAIATAYADISNILRVVIVYDYLLGNRISENGMSKNKNKLLIKLSEYNKLVEMYKFLPERAKDCQFLRNAKSKLDEKVLEVTAKYDLVSAISA